MKQYALIQAANPAQLIGTMNKALNEGWQLEGGIAMATTVVGTIEQKVVLIYAQALSKEQTLVTP